MADRIPLKLTGSPIADPALPAALRPALRGVGPGRSDEFLPDGYVKITSAFDVGKRSRSTPEGVVEKTIQAAADDVIVLEMADGVTVITSAAKLERSLKRVKPESVEADGTLKLDALHERAEESRGIIGDTVSDLVVRVFTLAVGDVADPILDAAKRKLAEWLGEKAEHKLQEYSGLGVTWLGTKALMWAIENQLDRKPGLYRWQQGMGQPADLIKVAATDVAQVAKEGPLLVFIHGTGSSTLGSFGDLQKISANDWDALEAKFGGRIYGFEHLTLSESPIQNAIELATQLPKGAQVNLVTHSRGGIVGDLLCLDAFSDELIEQFKSDLPEPGDVPEDERERLKKEIANAHAEQRAKLRDLRALLQDRQFAIRRYVRVAAPARGTLLASGNFDVFLSALLTLIGRVPYLYGNPLYYAFKRVVLEIAKNRTNAKLVPGIEAMLPDAPMARFLASAKPQGSTQFAAISGDTEGGGLLKRLGVLFTDYAFFSGVDNDLVVDTGSMYAGIAREAHGRALFDQGPTTSHFHYFQNDATRAALRDWLTVESTETLDLFKSLPGEVTEPSLVEETARVAAARRSRGGAAAEASLPIVIVLPGIMGSHLWRNTQDRIWFDFPDLVAGGLEKLSWGATTGSDAGDGLTPEKLFDMSYGDLCLYLMDTHRVERFPYDWRLPLNNLAGQLEKFLRRLMDETNIPLRPIRLLAHSMGGLVVRALIHQNPQLWDELMGRAGARFIMLGTPNQGAHSMVEALLGKSDTLRSLARVDLQHDLQAILNIIGEFRGALQLLPKTGFRDVGETPFDEYYSVTRWSALKAEMKDFWFGDRVAAVPSEAALNQGKWLWDRDGLATPALPERHTDKTIYVHGSAPLTACGMQKIDGRWKMIGTNEGDGTVTWKSGAISGIGRRYYMPAVHGDLAATPEYFAGIAELLQSGATGQLQERAPEVRDPEAAKPKPYEAGPPRYAMPEEAAHALMGAPKRKRLKARPVSTLKVIVKAMDLRFVTQPIMVGHYEQDAISGAESIIDRELVEHALSERHNLGLYAGPIGTAVVVFRLPNEAERMRGTLNGAVVTGLGTYDGTLSANQLTEAVRAGALRYLLQYLDCSGVALGDIGLCTLLLGYNSTASLTIQASVESLVQGVIGANQKFAEATRRPLRIGSLEIVELYLDTAISAMRYLRQFAQKVNSESNGPGVRLEVPEELQQDRGVRPRLDDSRAVGYWPRMMITDADRDDEICPPEGLESRRVLQADDLQVEAAVPGAMAKPWTNPVPRVAFAERLKFVHVGQRARAETIVQQRQPGLVESLVAGQIQEKSYQPDFSRTLFQLMVPHDFKDAARHLERIVLVVDGYTANLPWELMLAEDVPMAVRVPVVRQLSSSKFRRQVRQSVEPLAYVVGNPSTKFFFKNFPTPGKNPDEGLIALDGAEREAEVVVEGLRRYGYGVEQAIGESFSALKVINPLYQKPYRIIHIAAHGLFDLRAVDGQARSGVVLSDGLLLTAAEIGQMEIVPDLVFLNCCHLAKMDARPVAYNRLAYSVSRELIEIGVRCVVCAGWAVDDDAASTFAEVFYQALLHDKLEFGQAVFDARRETYRKHATSITWGAYQAYGDPGWRLNPRNGSVGASKSDDKFVSPEELLDAVNSFRVSIGKQREALNKIEAKRKAAELERLLGRCPKDWTDKPFVSFALATAFADLGSDFFDKACRLYSAAIAEEDKAGRVPITAIEQLANLESRLGEQQGYPNLVDHAIERMRQLDELTASKMDYQTGGPQGAVRTRANAERQSLIGAAYKRKAAIYASRIVKGDASAASDFDAAIRASIASYQQSAKPVSSDELHPYALLNQIALQAVLGQTEGVIELCRRCSAKANANFMESASFWDAIMVPEAFLIEALCSGILSDPGESGDRALEKVIEHYEASLRSIQVLPKEMDSVTQQLNLLALFFEAKKQSHIAHRLRRLAERLNSQTSTAQ
ncbi:MAG TPA: CHAT domain-containing protein [Candidatus Binatia bacterium]|nr:CHAT domain-containing protein [Candidatus Binatia bacterium]